MRNTHVFQEANKPPQHVFQEANKPPQHVFLEANPPPRTGPGLGRGRAGAGPGPSRDPGAGVGAGGAEFRGRRAEFRGFRGVEFRGDPPFIKRSRVVHLVHWAEERKPCIGCI